METRGGAGRSAGFIDKNEGVKANRA